MTSDATPAEVAQLEEAVNAIRSRAAHLQAIAEELEALIEVDLEEIESEEVVPMTERLETLDQLLTGETSLNDAPTGIPGLDQIMENLDELELE
ncbi:MAG: hypothetical protein JWL76_519 [Thermoleophilia bacterium]|nr:hypothetical protein [Thermoleophilia bacterium]